MPRDQVLYHKTLPGYGSSGSGAKPKELMLSGSLSGEPRYASILWADDQGISSETFRSLSFFFISPGARGVNDPVPVAPSAPWLLVPDSDS